ncbi:uncharacterized protein DDB_G0283697-like [Palaemon carinicauda]|uniref:uncharacterized protein DDB_G0283697-like n=1 Tax=Palaemon carinicauda TaxID=392227 RepID=UPI0035B5A896
MAEGEEDKEEERQKITKKKGRRRRRQKTEEERQKKKKTEEEREKKKEDRRISKTEEEVRQKKNQPSAAKSVLKTPLMKKVDPPSTLEGDENLAQKLNQRMENVLDFVRPIRGSLRPRKDIKRRRQSGKVESFDASLQLRRNELLDVYDRPGSIRNCCQVRRRETALQGDEKAVKGQIKGRRRDWRLREGERLEIKGRRRDWRLREGGETGD